MGTGRRGVLLVHGFAGSPFEVRPLGQALAEQGLQVSGPALAGHGPDAARLGETGWDDWYASVERAFDELRAQCDTVGVAGLSMGGVLALSLAARRCEVAALVTMAAPLWIARWQMKGIRLLGRSLRLGRLAVPKPFGSDLADTEMRRKNPTRSMPIAALGQLLDGMEQVRPRLGSVHCPALVVHGRHDHTVPFACADAIAAGLGGSVERLVLERSRHVITLDLDRAELFERVGDFFDRRLAQVERPVEQQQS